MINQVYLEKLVSLVRQEIITVEDIKIQEYRDAVQAVLNP